MKCKACHSDRPLIKAHIIPRSFYMDLRADDGFLNVIPSVLSDRVTKSNIGDYDPSILCHACDQLLGVFDDYGKQVLIDETHPFEEISKAGVVAGWIINDCDPVRLEKFFLAILWRASISSRSFFREVRLGPYEKMLKDYLWSEDADHISFGCVVAKFHSSRNESTLEKMMLSPGRFKNQGINYYRLYLGGYMIWIRVDKRKPTDTIGSCELSSNMQPVFFKKPFDNSNEFKIIHRMALVRDKKK